MSEPSIVLVVMTAGRNDYLERTIKSFEERVSGPITCRVMFDDSGDGAAPHRLGERHRDFRVFGRAERIGQAAQIASIFRFLQARPEQYVFWLEEDFTFDRDVDLADLIDLLERFPDIAQAQLLRGPWFRNERRAGGIIERDPAEYTFKTDRAAPRVEHRKWWTWNPSMFRREEIVNLEYSQGDRHEWDFGREVLAESPDRCFAFVGDGRPWVTHIGEERA